MDCSQAFSVEKTSKDGLLRSAFAGFLLNWCAIFHLSIVKKQAACLIKLSAAGHT